VGGGEWILSEFGFVVSQRTCNKEGREKDNILIVVGAVDAVSCVEVQWSIEVNKRQK
jgi:hypothetical protein